MSKGKKRWQSAELNNRTIRLYREMLEQLACAVWKWENLPDEIDTRFVELTLLNHGLSLFFYDDDFDAYFSLRATPQGKYNMYNNPVRYTAYGSNNYKKFLNADQCVPIWANYLRRGEYNAIELYARRLADIDRTIDVNLMEQKQPIIVTCPDSVRLTVENMMKEYVGNEPLIVADQHLPDTVVVDYLSPKAPYISDKLLSAKFSIWSEIMTYFGIDNQNIEKAERVQSAEVQANSGQIEANRLIRLNCRREACEKINRMFDLDITCNFNHDIGSRNYESENLIDTNYNNSILDDTEVL